MLRFCYGIGFFKWIFSQKYLKLRVTIADIKSKSQVLSTKPGFNNSNVWLSRFLMRWNISRITPIQIMQNKIND